MEIVFLGTSSMVPTKERNHGGVFIKCGAEGILVDCGEGTQRQMKIAGVKLTKIDRILISHWHGDHVLGLPGLIQSMGASDYKKTLHIYGPTGTKAFMDKIFRIFAFDKAISIKIKEIKSGKFYKSDIYDLRAIKLRHNIPTLGYSVIEKIKRKMDLASIKKMGIPHGPLLGKLQSGKNIEWKGKKIDFKKVTREVKGKKISIVTDTLPCTEAVLLAEDSDILISEATYTQDLEDKARKYKHMTARQAAELAKKSKTKKLILTHFSARYKDANESEKEAKRYFKNTSAAKDFMKIGV